jgi:hypothetical protein
MDFTWLQKLLLNYIQKNPQIVEQLLDALVKRLVLALQQLPPPTPNS